MRINKNDLITIIKNKIKSSNNDLIKKINNLEKLSSDWQTAEFYKDTESEYSLQLNIQTLQKLFDFKK